MIGDLEGIGNCDAYKSVVISMTVLQLATHLSTRDVKNNKPALNPRQRLKAVLLKKAAVSGNMRLAQDYKHYGNGDNKGYANWQDHVEVMRINEIKRQKNVSGLEKKAELKVQNLRIDV